MSCSYSFINGLEMLNIVGTYEKAEMEEGEVYEVVNIKTLKQATPNLRIINLYGINFVDDTHIEAFSSNCIQLQVRNGPKYYHIYIVRTFIYCPNLWLFFYYKNIKSALNAIYNFQL